MSDSQLLLSTPKCIGIAADHEGYELKEQLVKTIGRSCL